MGNGGPPLASLFPPSQLIVTKYEFTTDLDKCQDFLLLQGAARGKYHGIEAAMPLRLLGSDFPTLNENPSPALPNIDFVPPKLPLPR